MDDGNRVSADAPFWWTSLPQLHTFTLSSADALWLKGVREGALAVARTPWSDAAGRRTAQLGESQNYFVTMGTQNPDITCTAAEPTPTRSAATVAATAVTSASLTIPEPEPSSAVAVAATAVAVAVATHWKEESDAELEGAAAAEVRQAGV